MFEPNENLASLHSLCTRNENVGRSLFVRHRKSKFMGVKLPDFVICKRTIDDYFDLWLLQGAAGPTSRKCRFLAAILPFDDVCDAVTSSMTNARPLFRARSGESWGIEAVALAVGEGCQIA